MINFNKVIQEDIDFIVKSDLPWSNLEGKNILISGASGALPAYMVETILYLNNHVFKNKAKIFALVRNEAKARVRFRDYGVDDNISYVIQDVCEKVIIDDKLDYIIHAASQASPKYYGHDPVGTLLPNTIGTYNLLELAREKKVEGFLFFSAGAVYGNIANKRMTTEEDFGSLDPLSIESCYSESKRMGENMCSAWHSQYKIPIKVIRPFHTYGPGIALDDGRVFADFCKNIINNENININSDGSAKRSFCYLADAVVGFFTVLLKGEVGQAYNVAGDEEISILELATLLVGVFPEKNLRVTYQQKNTDGYLRTNIGGYEPNNNKLKRLGWRQKYSISDGFKRTINNYQYEKNNSS